MKLDQLDRGEHGTGRFPVGPQDDSLTPVGSSRDGVLTWDRSPPPVHGVLFPLLSP